MSASPPVDLLVVGGGLAGLLAAWRARRERPQARVGVLEASTRAGGVIESVREDGFLIERAASTARAGASALLQVVRELGLEGELVESTAAARRRWILRRGRLVAAPTSPLALVTTRLLSLRAKLRLLKEPWIARGGVDDETLAAFVARRCGQELVDPLLDAVVTGIFAGDPRRLEARAAFPKLCDWEERHGSVLRGGRREALRRRGLLALRGGMQQLVDRLVGELGGAIGTGTTVVSLAREGRGREEGDRDGAGAGAPSEDALWRVETSDGSTWRARSVVLATPAHVSARLVAPFDERLARELAAIESANVAVVAIGLRREQVGADVRGLGFLVPSSEATPLLGVLFESSLFPGRAPEGHVLLRAMVGGERAALPDDRAAVAELAWREASRVLSVAGSPRLLRAFLHQPGIPQYRPGHTARLARIDRHLENHADLRLAGWSYRGIALDDRARETMT